MEPDHPSRLVDVKTAQLILPCSPWKIIQMAHDGTLPSVRIGRKFYFDIVDVLKIKQFGTSSPLKAQSRGVEVAAL
jgi:hypothetical protein